MWLYTFHFLTHKCTSPPPSTNTYTPQQNILSHANCAKIHHVQVKSEIQSKNSKNLLTHSCYTHASIDINNLKCASFTCLIYIMYSQSYS